MPRAAKKGPATGTSSSGSPSENGSSGTGMGGRGVSPGSVGNLHAQTTRDGKHAAANGGSVGKMQGGDVQYTNGEGEVSMSKAKSPALKLEVNTSSPSIEGLARSNQTSLTNSPQIPPRESSLDALDMGRRHVPQTPSTPSHGEVPSQHLKRSPSLAFLSLTMTVLKTCPLQDALAILVLLLAIPATVVPLTNFVFIILTLIPQTLSFRPWSTAAGLKDMANVASPSVLGGGPLGTPSLPVLLVMDVFVTLIYYLCTQPLQALALDYAQVFVAATLSGGSAIRSNAIEIKLGILTLVHAMSFSHYKSYILEPTSQTLLSLPKVVIRDRPVPRFDREASYWACAQVLVSVHILSYGLTRMIRRWLMPSVKLELSPLVPERQDQESGTDERRNTEQTSDSPIRSTPESRSRAPTLPSRDSASKISSGKKRRKQGHFARGQQPLWAAIAARRISWWEATEQSKIAAEDYDSGSQDAQNLGSAKFEMPGQIWITSIGPRGFFFAANQLSTSSTETCPDEHDAENTCVQPKGPFYLKLNGVRWITLNISRGLLPHEGHWVGEVYGLTPGATYVASFRTTDNDSVIHEEHITTSNLADADTNTASTPIFSYPRKMSVMASNIPPSTSFSNLAALPGPELAIATLKASCLSLEDNTTSILESQKRARREAQATRANLQREIDSYRAQLGRRDDDDKSAGRTSGHLTSISQLEGSMKALEQEIQDAAEIPDSINDEHRSAKTQSESARSQLEYTRTALTDAKDEATKVLANLRLELQAARNKEEKTQSRKQKLAAQCDRLVSEQDDDESSTSTKQATGSTSTSVEDASASELARWENAIVQLRRDIEYLDSHHVHLESRMQECIAASEYAHPARPDTPEGDLPGEKTFSNSNGLAVGKTYTPSPKQQGRAFDTPDSHFANLARVNGFQHSPAPEASDVFEYRHRPQDLAETEFHRDRWSPHLAHVTRERDHASPLGQFSVLATQSQGQGFNEEWSVARPASGAGAGERNSPRQDFGVIGSGSSRRPGLMQ